tara:strand:- start:271 stop:393 length:123 start_codon:yes stop_codon:yes gene_type:complete
MKRKGKPFKLDCFGFLGIILLIGGIGSIVFSIFAIMEMMK